MHLLFHLVICGALLLSMHCIDARKSPSSGNSMTESGGASTLAWRVPSHLSADRDNAGWIRRGVANEQSLTCLVDRDKKEDRDGKDEEEVNILGLVARGFYLLLLFSPAFWTSGLAFLSIQFRNEVWYRLLCWAIENSGAAFIKWGQWSSTRPDMFPTELCKRLEKLQAGSPVHSFAYTQKMIETELGSKISDIFTEFDEKPTASGSIAQVYKAVLNGEEVAVKVRHPNVREQIIKDFIIMKWLANFFENVLGMKWLNLSESLSQFSGTIASQTRLDVEGWHLHLFNENFGKWRDVSFPRPIVITESVLIESFEKGETVSKYAKIRSTAERVLPNEQGTLGTRKPLSLHSADYAPESDAQLDLSHFIVCRGEDIYLKMLIQDNLMHADLHPGNILVDAKHGDNTTHKVILVDAGMVARLMPEERRNFIGMLAAVGDGNGSETARFVLNFSPSNSYSDETKIEFTAAMVEFFDKNCHGYGTNVDLGETLRGIMALCRVHKVSVSANYATLIVNVLCLDGMATSLLPSYNILDGAKMFLSFYRFCARKGCLPLAKLFVPIARRIKAVSDRQFLKRERMHRSQSSNNK